MMKSKRLVCRVMFLLITLGLAVAAPAHDIPELLPGQLNYVQMPEELGGGQLWFARAGQPGGQRVLFLHGTPSSMLSWRHYLMNVPPGLEYITVDRPASGMSDPERVLPIMQQVELMEQFLQPSADGRKPIVVGHSYGGSMAAIMAELYQDKIGAVVILAGAVSPYLNRPLLIQRLAQYPPLVYLLPAVLRNSNDEAVALEQELIELEGIWQNVRLPLVVLQGERDWLVSVKNLDFMRENMVNAELDIRILEGVWNHFLAWDYTAEVEERIQTAVNYANRER